MLDAGSMPGTEPSANRSGPVDALSAVASLDIDSGEAEDDEVQQGPAAKGRTETPARHTILMMPSKPV